MTDFLDRDIEQAEARLAQLREDRARREADQREREAGQNYADTRDSIRQEEGARMAHDYALKFNNAPLDAYGSRVGISPRETDRFCGYRFTDHITNELLFWRRLQTRPLSDFTTGGSQ